MNRILSPKSQTSNSMAPTILKVSRDQMIVIIQPRYAKTGMVIHQSPEMIILNPMLPLVWILHPIFLIRMAGFPF